MASHNAKQKNTECDVVCTSHNSLLMEKSTLSLQCDGDITTCAHVSTLQHMMKLYLDETAHRIHSLNEICKTALESFCHFLSAHDCNQNDDVFDFICDKLGACDLSQCQLFHRIYRQRDDTDNQCIDDDDIAHVQILSKIHCHFAHCYDLGYRVSAEECANLYAEDEDKKQDEEDVDRLFANAAVCQIKQMQLERRKQREHSLKTHESDTPSFNKYIPNFSRYEKGRNFYYGFDGERESQTKLNLLVRVRKTFTSLKEEITQNAICCLSMDTFNHEYDKMLLHLHSLYCQIALRPKLGKYEETMLQNSLLSMMLYCNFTNLSYEFSKTYRDEDRKRHRNFYWMGSGLKFAVHVLGTKAADGNITKLFHGIGQRLELSVGSVPTQNYTAHQLQISVLGSVYGPLSTSSSFAVAMHFVNHTDGMVLTVRPDEECEYFSCAWLSDFSNESEYFFIHCAGYFTALSVLDATCGFDYCALLKSACCICGDTVSVSGSQHVDIGGIFSRKHEKLTSRLIAYRISYGNSGQSLAKSIIDSLCNSVTSINLDYHRLQTQPILFTTFWRAESQCVRWDNVMKIYPNLSKVTIFMKKFAAESVENIYAFLSTQQRKPQITIDHCSGETDVAESEFVAKFSKIGCDVSWWDHGKFDDDYERVPFENHRRTIIKYVDVRESSRETALNCIMGADGKAEQLYLDVLINQRLIQQILDECIFGSTPFLPGETKRHSVAIRYTKLRNYAGDIFAALCRSDIKWIQWHNVMKLCSNVKVLDIEHVCLCSEVMEELYQYLSQDSVPDTLCTIHVSYGDDGKYSLNEHCSVILEDWTCRFNSCEQSKWKMKEGFQHISFERIISEELRQKQCDGLVAALTNLEEEDQGCCTM